MGKKGDIHPEIAEELELMVRLRKCAWHLLDAETLLLGFLEQDAFSERRLYTKEDLNDLQSLRLSVKKVQSVKKIVLKLWSSFSRFHGTEEPILIEDEEEEDLCENI